MTNYDLGRKIEGGLIDLDKYVDFDINQYFNQILYDKSDKELENQNRAKQL